jgi:hypothetical protein
MRAPAGRKQRRGARGAGRQRRAGSGAPPCAAPPAPGARAPATARGPTRSSPFRPRLSAPSTSRAAGPRQGGNKRRWLGACGEKKGVWWAWGVQHVATFAPNAARGARAAVKGGGWTFPPGGARSAAPSRPPPPAAQAPEPPRGVGCTGWRPAQAQSRGYTRGVESGAKGKAQVMQAGGLHDSRFTHSSGREFMRCGSGRRRGFTTAAEGNGVCEAPRAPRRGRQEARGMRAARVRERLPGVCKRAHARWQKGRPCRGQRELPCRAGLAGGGNSARTNSWEGSGSAVVRRERGWQWGGASICQCRVSISAGALNQGWGASVGRGPRWWGPRRGAAIDRASVCDGKGQGRICQCWGPTAARAPLGLAARARGWARGLIGGSAPAVCGGDGPAIAWVHSEGASALTTGGAGTRPSRPAACR